MISTLLMAMALQAAGDSQRKEFVGCLREAVTKAMAEKIAPDAFGTFVEQTCGSVEASFKAALVSFDVKNKVSRKQAESDAELQIEDYVAGALDRYKSQVSPQ